MPHHPKLHPSEEVQPQGLVNAASKSSGNKVQFHLHWPDVLPKMQMQIMQGISH